MKRTTKFILLFAALLLPALIYIFLKRFGRNEFDVPALFQEAITAPVDCESNDYSLPYVVPEPTLVALGWSPEKVNLFVFSGPVAAKATLRIFDEFAGDSFALNEVAIELRKTAACALLLQPPLNAVMVDGEGKIRGQYDLGNREDVDRLIVELKIMLILY